MKITKAEYLGLIHRLTSEMSYKLDVVSRECEEGYYPDLTTINDIGKDLDALEQIVWDLEEGRYHKENQSDYQ